MKEQQILKKVFKLAQKYLSILQSVTYSFKLWMLRHDFDQTFSSEHDTSQTCPQSGRTRSLSTQIFIRHFRFFRLFSQIKSQLKNQSDIESHFKGVLFCGKG